MAAVLVLFRWNWRICALVIASYVAGVTAWSFLPEQRDLLVAYALIDGGVGVLVQLPRRWPHKLVGLCYGVFTLSHLALFFQVLGSGQHDIIGVIVGWAIVAILFLWGANDGGYTNWIVDRLGISGRAAGSSNSGEEKC